MTKAEQTEELERLRAENALLKERADPPLKLKVSQKGAVSVYGLGRFPTTLYREQWIKVLDADREIRAFIESHQDELATRH